jgi:hypothetical protein
VHLMGAVVRGLTAPEKAQLDESWNAPNFLDLLHVWTKTTNKQIKLECN